MCAHHALDSLEGRGRDGRVCGGGRHWKGEGEGECAAKEKIEVNLGLVEEIQIGRAHV